MAAVRVNSYQITLLQSLLSNPKYLDMGKSPVNAIQACFELSENGLVTIDESGWVFLTDKGRDIAVNERVE